LSTFTSIVKFTGRHHHTLLKVVTTKQHQITFNNTMHIKHENTKNVNTNKWSSSM